MKNHPRGAFGSNFGAMMAVAGSAVGLGNIWRFPFLAGQNGGAAFLIIYLALVLVVGLPLVLSEFSIGRAAKLGPIKAFNKLAPGTRWHWIGYLSVVIGFVLMGFYSVVAGWTLRFLTDSLAGGFAGQSPEHIKETFETFSTSTWEPMIYAGIFIAACSFIVVRGVKKGVEKFNKILMPALFVMLILLCINSFTLDGWRQGMTFLFEPDWSKVTSQTIIDALGQVFFTLSIGMGVMITYSSYVVKKDNMVRSKGFVSLIDTSVAILSGVAIFPAVFTFGLQPDEGPQLVFVTLPNVFAQMPGGYFFAILFFAMLSIAAITSAISIIEMLTAIFIEQFDVTRKRAVTIICVMIGVLALLCASSRAVFDFFDTLSANYLLTICGLTTAIFVGWVFNRKLLYDTFTSDGQYSKKIYPLFIFALRFIAPPGIAFIILNKLGII